MTPLEPLYTLRVAAELVPFVHVGALRDFLYKHRALFPSRTVPIARRRVRMLTHRELSRIRVMRVKEKRSTPPRDAVSDAKSVTLTRRSRANPA